MTSLVALVVKDPPANARDIRDQVDPCMGKIPWRREWQSALVFLLDNPMDRGAWRATVHGIAENLTRTEMT